MSTKLGGAALLLCAFALLSRSWIGERRREIRLIRALAQALERIVGVIRWQKLPFPRVLEEESRRTPGGEYFRQITEYMKSGMTLQMAWQKAFEEFPSVKARELLCCLELGGDAQRLIGQFHLVAEELRSCGNGEEVQQRQAERIWLTAGGCVSVMMIIILI